MDSSDKMASPAASSPEESYADIEQDLRDLDTFDEGQEFATEAEVGDYFKEMEDGSRLAPIAVRLGWHMADKALGRRYIVRAVDDPGRMRLGVSLLHTDDVNLAEFVASHADSLWGAVIIDLQHRRVNWGDHVTDFDPTIEFGNPVL